MKTLSIAKIIRSSLVLMVCHAATLTSQPQNLEETDLPIEDVIEEEETPGSSYYYFSVPPVENEQQPPEENPQPWDPNQSNGSESVVEPSQEQNEVITESTTTNTEPVIETTQVETIQPEVPFTESATPASYSFEGNSTALAAPQEENHPAPTTSETTFVDQTPLFSTGNETHHAEESPKVEQLSLTHEDEKHIVEVFHHTDLSDGKGTVKIIKKPTADHHLVGMPLVNIPSVGAIETPETEIAKEATRKDDIIEVATSPKEGSIHSYPEEKGLISQFLTARSLLNLSKEEVPEKEIASSEQDNSGKLTIVTPHDHIDPAIIAQADIAPPQPPTAAVTPESQRSREISINFNNVAMIEYIRFISKISNKNFIFDENDLQFNVTIVSEEPTSVDNLMAALLQELKIRDLLLIEQGNNIIIHRNARVRAPAAVVTGDLPNMLGNNDLVTRVFRLNTLDPVKASEIIRPLLSDDALVEVLRDSNNLIITDLVANVEKIAQLVTSLDAPNSGLTIGQYAVRNAFVDSLAVLAERILQPIAQGNPFVLVPHPASNSIFIVSNPFIVERALAILENLDINEGRTKIFTLDRLKLQEAEAAAERERLLRSQENMLQNMQGGPGGFGRGLFGEGDEFAPGGLTSFSRQIQDLPVGHIARTLFFIYKLKYRRGDQIEIALRKIGDSLMLDGTTNAELISAINSIQWLESTNSLIFTGTVAALDKIKELIQEVDSPLRQVFIEMLILDTTINDSLRYGVEWGSRFGGGGTAGAEAFSSVPGGGRVASALQSGGAISTTPLADGVAIAGPDAINIINGGAEGFNWGIIGRHLTRDGTRFNTIAALVEAVHNDSKSRIVLNPKIITEDNHTAEIFVGSTARYKTQSISNDIGNVITNNFQFIDVGTTLRVTPLIGSDDVVTLDIIEEITNESPGANIGSGNTSIVDVNLVPVLSKSRTLTKVHIPNGFFVVLSGLIQNTNTRAEIRVPCLGGIPIIGALNKRKVINDDKHNLMIFIRPLIIDSEEDIEYLTKRQQDIYTEKSKFRRRWNYEIDEALDFSNFRPTDPDEIGCSIPWTP